MVDYGLPSYKQKPAKWLLSDPAQKLRFKERSLENKRKLAEAINDNAMLITGLRFYIARLRVNRRTPAAPIRDIETKKTGGFGQHLKAVRRLLGISYIKASTLAHLKHKLQVVTGDVMMLPGSYRAKLKAIGFDPWSDPDELADFESLNPHLQLDDEVAAFAQHWPILKNVRRFLLGEPPKAFGESPPNALKDQILHAPQNCAPGSLQNKIIADIKINSHRENLRRSASSPR
jgi:hypothetical protein